MDEKKLSRLFSFDGQHYHCYWNAMEEFKKLDASLAGFKEYDHIYSRIGTAKEKILYVEEDLDMGVEEGLLFFLTFAITHSINQKNN